MQTIEFLRSLAQNDYMIDGGYLPDGRRLLSAAREFELFLTALQDCTHAQQFLARFYADETVPRVEAKPGKSPLSSMLILAIYAEHEAEISEIWGQGEEEDEDRSLRDAVEIWLRRVLCGKGD